MIESLGADPARLQSGTSAPRSSRGIVGDRAEVEQHERVVRPVFQLLEQDPRIAIELPPAEGEVDIAGVPDDQVGPSDGYRRGGGRA